MQKVLNFFKNEIVLSIASLVAIITCVIIPFDKAYLNYFDYKTLICLFCMLAVVAGLKKTGIFKTSTKEILGIYRNFYIF